MQVDRTICMHCGVCVGSCPFNAVTLHETRIEFEKECNNCGLCIKACPVGAIWK
ncbi:MAG: 4Fe-4S binding protein [Candidatus Thermoplasmatota archaeon]